MPWSEKLGYSCLGLDKEQWIYAEVQMYEICSKRGRNGGNGEKNKNICMEKHERKWSWKSREGKGKMKNEKWKRSKYMCSIRSNQKNRKCTGRRVKWKIRENGGKWKMREKKNTVLFRPSVHVTHHNEKKLFCFIRLKSKEILLAILAQFFFQNREHLVKIVQYLRRKYDGIDLGE